MRRQLAELVHRLLPGLAVLVVLAFGTAPALADCEGDEYPLASYSSDVMRIYLTRTIADIETYFQVRFPAVCMDDNEYGAYIDLDRKGTMVIGTGFIWEMGEISLNHVAAVLAHETAHRFQFEHEVLDNLRASGSDGNKCIELHADFMAGGFMRYRSQTMKVRPEDIAKQFYNLGDSDIYARDHHGLGQERQLAFAAGYSMLYRDVTDNATMGFIFVSRANCDPRP